MSDYEVDLSCGCGASLKMTCRFHSEAIKTVELFTTAHKKCREPGLWQQVFDGAELMPCEALENG